MIEKIIDDFNHKDISRYLMNKNFVSSYDISLSEEQSKDGNKSLKLTYDYSGWKTGNGAMYIHFQTKKETETMPVSVGAWVYSEGEVPWLRLVLVDGKGERKTLNLTEHTMTWHGWKYVEAEVNPNWSLPLYVETLYAVEVDKTKQGKSSYHGTFYINRLRFLYSDEIDLQGPYFKNVFPKGGKVYQNSFLFKANIYDDKSGVDDQSIVVKVNEEPINFNFCREENLLFFKLEHLEEGVYTVAVHAKDLAGNFSVPYLKEEYEVDLSPDDEPPVVSDISPIDGSILYTKTPKICFKMMDEKSGVNQEDIRVEIDGIKQNVYYDEVSTWAYVLPSYDLSEGKHCFTIEAKDKASNEMSPVQKCFTVKHIKNNKKHLQIGVIPDTHSSEPLRLVIHELKKENVDFFIHLGDIVDQAKKEEFLAAKQIIDEEVKIPFLMTPGNHESFQDNLNYFKEYFGLSSYHLAFDNTLFIFLNSAFNQSITESNVSQFHFLQRVLKENDQKNVIIFTHVPTYDRFDTAHEMNKADAQKLEGILSKVKKENNERNIFVMFGHIHVLDHWLKEGVQYIISGNSAKKGYVSHEKGNVLGYGLLHINQEEISYEYKPYIDELHIVHKNKKVHEINLKVGEERRLHTYITVKKLGYDYEVDITDFYLIKKEWFSNDTKVVTVDHDSYICAQREGSTAIRVKVNDKIAELHVHVNR